MRGNWREGLAIVRNLPAWALAFVWRTLLIRTTFIAVTGSLGKTTAKDCLAAMLARLGPTLKTEGNSNGREGITRTILRVRPWHRFAVVEMGTSRPGGMVRGSLLVRPDVALILKVARIHTKEFKTLEETAAEKMKLLRFLRTGGTAVLNGDDPRVAAMAAATRGRVVWFGSSGDFDVRARDASSQWPKRLEFTACHGEEAVKVSTRLVGTHWLLSVTGAIAAAVACGVTLSQAAEAALEIEPHAGRMQPVELPNGAVLLRDEYNGSLASFEVAIEALRQAQAKRRVLVIGDCSDFRRKPKQRMQYYARVAGECAQAVVFVGERCGEGVAYARREGVLCENAHGFQRLEDAAEFLRREVSTGDLVLLRGRCTEHLSRLYFAMFGSVRCAKTVCPRQRLCDDCPELGFRPRQEPLAAIVCAE
jgi:UDP-N-acetylmuramoyl-tripeptide--D-alanyl-D-alanine ligase